MLTTTDDPSQPRDVNDMDDSEVVAERQRIAVALAALTDQYRALNQEMSRRKTLQWMLAP